MRGNIQKISLLIMLSIVLLSSSSVPIMSTPPHYDYDEAEWDRAVIYSSLNYTNTQMNDTLGLGLDVNYSQEVRDDGLIENSYDEEKFEIINETEEEINSNLVAVKEVIEDDDGNINSSRYLKRYYLPFYHLSENLTTFSEVHYRFVYNMNQTVNLFNELQQDEISLFEEDIGFEERIDESSLALRTMNSTLDEILEENIDRIEEKAGEDRFNLIGFLDTIERWEKRIETYRGFLDFMEREIDLTAFLTVRAPEIVHPCEKLVVEGNYFGGRLFEMDTEFVDNLEKGSPDDDLIEKFELKGHPLSAGSQIDGSEEEGEWLIESDGLRRYRVEEITEGIEETLAVSLEKDFAMSETIEIYFGEKKLGLNESRENSYFSSEIQIPWDIFSSEEDWGLKEEDTVQLKAVSEDQNITSESHHISVERWDTEIELEFEEEREAFYQEYVNVSGRFRTDAPISFEDIRLNFTNLEDDAELPGEDTGSVIRDEENFSFEISYHTEMFYWGKNEIEVSYQGNETLDGDEGSISFEKSIPTELIIDTNKEEDVEVIDIEGHLFNSSSEESDDGLEGKEVYLKLDDKEQNESLTGPEGDYKFNISLDELSEGDELYVHFEGTEKFREADSDRLLISYEVIHGEDDDPDDMLGILTEERNLLLIMGIIIGMVILLWYWKGKEEFKEDEEAHSSEKEKTSEKKKKDIWKKQTPSLQASSKEEVSSIYGILLRELYSKDIITVEKGKTHRELERELISRIALKEEIKQITTVFEKALFSDRVLDPSELELFNSSMKELQEELL